MNSQSTALLSRTRNITSAGKRSSGWSVHTVGDLIRSWPEPMAAAHALQRRRMADLARDYASYVSTVSPPNFAVSLESAALLAVFYESLDTHRILDLGSGFSTYVASMYTTGSQVVTVDDDSEWLARSMAFIESKGRRLPTTRLLRPNVLAEEANADFVFYDLGRMDTRAANLDEALRAVKPGGWALIDDTHKPRYRALVMKSARAAGGDLFDVAPWTIDSFGRSSLLWVAPKSSAG